MIIKQTKKKMKFKRLNNIFPVGHFTMTSKQVIETLKHINEKETNHKR